MTEQEYKDVMEIIRQELEDVEVEEDGGCRWTDVANANTHIQARLRVLAQSPQETDANG